MRFWYISKSCISTNHLVYLSTRFVKKTLFFEITSHEPGTSRLWAPNFFFSKWHLSDPAPSPVDPTRRRPRLIRASVLPMPERSLIVTAALPSPPSQRPSRPPALSLSSERTSSTAELSTASSPPSLCPDQHHRQHASSSTPVNRSTHRSQRLSILCTVSVFLKGMDPRNVMARTSSCVRCRLDSIFKCILFRSKTQVDQ